MMEEQKQISELCIQWILIISSYTEGEVSLKSDFDDRVLRLSPKPHLYTMLTPL